MLSQNLLEISQPLMEMERPEEVTHLYIEDYCAACVSLEFLYDLHQLFVNVEPAI
ncbi:hypothetical protein DPMN_187441 [Dreissena polymorpha]|uniref:Uncharacterized protein n=1 Tax=Dreissena polymorpha TaxID=45954 RepID=A0A9D4I920_DREPO|nr:hypothetical protein DPMN_187441 [Dreissena polymorpha]